ncbi:MAG TPA: hypothetical protein VFY72_08565 [Beijerinckiaceae bacterium]|nr:hypothetical protein [Beijerinckiaceae bacterium]
MLDTVAMLADQIARAAPECADQAMQIVKLVQELNPMPDRALIEDTLSVETADTDVSEARVQATTDAVMQAVKIRY